jgi:hypothetical protein
MALGTSWTFDKWVEDLKAMNTVSVWDCFKLPSSLFLVCYPPNSREAKCLIYWKEEEEKMLEKNMALS